MNHGGLKAVLYGLNKEIVIQDSFRNSPKPSQESKLYIGRKGCCWFENLFSG